MNLVVGLAFLFQGIIIMEDINHDIQTLCLGNRDSLVKEESVSEKVSVKGKKEQIRLRIWKLMEDNKYIKSYPETCFQKIPNFKRCAVAAEKLSRLREFRRAKYVKINPSMAQMHLRFLTLKYNKILLVPSPALCEDFMYKVDSSQFSGFWQLKRASSKAGAKELGKKLDLNEKLKIDLYVVASVACSANGVRLGKGLGYAEIEWAIFYEKGIVNQETIVITTVHDCQVLPPEELPISMQCAHDLPVDIIVTPTRVINVRKKLKKPSNGILWDMITDNYLKNIPILAQLKGD